MPRTAAVLLLFAGSMFGLVCSDNLFLLFMFWELTSITSFLLIGTNDENAGARSAALHALLVTGGGGLAMLGGFVLIGQAAGTYSLHAILTSPPSGTTVTVGLVLVLAGALTKSAQVPFHSWLPGAMAAPTPISAYLHSATMVKAGVYLIARFAPAFAVVGPWRWIVLGRGGASMLLGGYRALRQHDLKLVLAFGTISQLGLLVVLFGAGVPELAFAGCVLLIAHAAFKAALFLTVGVIDHQTHTRDLRALTGLGRRLPVVAAGAALAAASMAGLPPLLGFIAKELALDGLLGDDVPARWVLLAVVVVGSMFTVAYSARFLWGAFGPADTRRGFERTLVGPRGAAPLEGLRGRADGPRRPRAAVRRRARPHRPAGRRCVGGVRLRGPRPPPHPLARPHRPAGAVGAGRRRWCRCCSSPGTGSSAGRPPCPHVPSAAGRLRAVDQGPALRAPARSPVWSRAARCPCTSPSCSSPWWSCPVCRWWPPAGPPSWPDLVDSPIQLVIGSIMVIAALAAAVSRRRFAAVLLLSAVGYGMAALFMVQGAPDLALTQLLVETLGTVAFVLVLRHLPEGFSGPSTPTRKLVPAVVGVLVAVFVFFFTLTSGSVTGTPTPDPELAGTDYGVSAEHGATDTPDGITALRGVHGPVAAGGPRQERGERDRGRLPRLRHPGRDHRAARRGHGRGGPGPGGPQAP